MKKLCFMVAVACLFLVLEHCAKVSPEDKAVAFFQGVVNVLKSNQDNPDKAGDALKAFIESNKKVMEELKAIKGDEQKKLEGSEKIKKVMEEFTGIMGKLMQDPKFQESQKFQEALKAFQ